jgi:hypothetical protein
MNNEPLTFVDGPKERIQILSALLLQPNSREKRMDQQIDIEAELVLY